MKIKISCILLLVITACGGAGEQDNGETEVALSAPGVRITDSFETDETEYDVTSDSITGFYETGGGKAETYQGSVKVRYLGNRKFSFGILISNQAGCTGEISDTALVDSNNLGRFSGEDCKSLTFEFSRDKVVIKEIECEFHGMRCGFEGEYNRVK
jgi:hypothetical protein